MFETVFHLLSIAIFGGLGLVFLLTPDRVVAWARRRLSPGPIHTEPSYARNFVLSSAYRPFVILTGILLLLGTLLLVTRLIWGEPPTQPAAFRYLRESWPPIVRC